MNKSFLKNTKNTAKGIIIAVLFGLGSYQQVDKLEIRWTDGHTENFRNLIANRYLTIIQDKGIQ